MDKHDLMRLAAAFVEESAGNYIDRQTAISEKVAGLKIYDAPLAGVCSPLDPLFSTLQDPAVVGPHFIMPRDWMPEAKSVVSLFLPFTDRVKKGAGQGAWPSEEWLHGRIEGQAFINSLCRHMMAVLAEAGYKSLTPALDERFWGQMAPDPNSGRPEMAFTSNWSERHVAYICGLGTFGLSRGLITARGIAGRFGSILTDLELPPDPREHELVLDYCRECGVCVNTCPVKAISIDAGKEHPVCSAFLDKTLERFKPRFGCQKCQTGTPCASGIPGF